MPGGQARISGALATAQTQAASPFVLDGLLGTTPASHSPWSVVGRAFGSDRCRLEAAGVRSALHVPGWPDQRVRVDMVLPGG